MQVTDSRNSTSRVYDDASKKVTLGAEATSTLITVRVTPESVLPIPAAAAICGAEDVVVQCYTIEVYRIRDNPQEDTSLQTLTLAPIPDSQTIADDISLTNGDFMARVTTDTTHVTVTANPTDPGATYSISPSDARAGDGDNEGHQVSLTAGAVTTIRITVTAEDTAVRKTYTVKVYRNRAMQSSDNNLNRLSLSAGTLTPTFNKDTQLYTAQVADDVDKVTVSYTASDTAGGSTVGVTSTTSGASVANNEVTLLEVGTTNITITVTAENSSETDGSEPKVYTISVYRLRPLPAANATLAESEGITVDPGTLAPPYAPGTKTYNVKVENGTSAITVMATAAAATAGATVAITPNNGSNVALAIGVRTPITITVTAEDRITTDTYMVSVYRERDPKSDEATLSALSLSAGTLSPAFMSDTIEYKTRVAHAVDKVTVSRTLNDDAGGATAVVGTFDDATCTTPVAVDGDITLMAGDNTYICVTATAEDDSTEVYAITVYRMSANLSTDASLPVFSITEVTGTIPDLDGDGDRRGRRLIL